VFIAKNKKHDIYGKHIVLIFDECHRSQFGKMHTNIIAKFKTYNIFGYTGTPIFAVNASASGNPFLKTTVQAFGCAVHADDLPVCSANKNHQSALHTYTIVDAIHDTNVLPFRIDYIDTVKMKDSIKDVKVMGIDTEGALVSAERIKAVTTYILEHFDQKTYRNENGLFFTHRIISNVEEVAAAKDKTTTEKKETKHVNGFNSILCVSSAVTIDDKRVAPVELYYKEFKRQLAETGRDLKVATIFSFAHNEDEPLDGEDFDTDNLDASSRDFLNSAIADYNSMFGTNYDSGEKFQNYYKDLSLRVKNREVDLLIVVNMFLTGFDATTLNTLWVDKNLRLHGLIQAFSRTNRILNSVKKFGNIVCFRDLTKETDEAVAIFGDKEAGGIVILRTFREYMEGYDDNDGKHKPGYVELIADLTENFPLGEDIVGEEAQKECVRLFGAVLKMANLLSAFDEFQGQERLSLRDFQNYQSIYLDIRDEFRNKPEKESINDDIEFEQQDIILDVDFFRPHNLLFAALEIG
jgi:type I restriction enzyme R subunit